MASIKELVETHGIPCTLQAKDRIFRAYPFTVIKHLKEDSRVIVKYGNGEIGIIEDEVPSCNDYELVDSLTKL